MAVEPPAAPAKPPAPAKGLAVSQSQKLGEMREELERLKATEDNWEVQMEQAKKDRQEARDRQNALQWLRVLLFPFIEEQASAYSMTVFEAASKIVKEKTRIDILLREHWQNSDIQGLLDSGPAKMMMGSAAPLLSESDQKTKEGADWLLDRVLPADPEGMDIQQAFLNDRQLWQDTIVGLKKLFASRIVRPQQPAQSRTGAIRF